MSAISPLLVDSHPGLQGSSSISSGPLDRILLSWMSMLKLMLNTNTTWTQTTEDGFLVTSSFNSQIPSKSFNWVVTKQSPFAVWLNIPMNIPNPTLFSRQEQKENQAPFPGAGRGRSEPFKMRDVNHISLFSEREIPLLPLSSLIMLLPIRFALRTATDQDNPKDLPFSLTLHPMLNKR